MKRFLSILPVLLLLSVQLVLTGCPTQTEFPLIASRDAAEIPGVSLAGKWRAKDDSADAHLVSFQAFGKGNYEVKILEKGSAQMSSATIFHGWTGMFEGMNVLVLEESDATGLQSGKFYVYELQAKGQNGLQTRNIGLLVGGTDAIKSTATFQDEVRLSRKKGQFLFNPLEWVRE